MRLAGVVPATGRETSMWLLEQVVPGSGVNNLSFALRVDGGLRPELVEELLRAAVHRHDALRTVFHVDNDTVTKEVLVPGAAQPVLTQRTCTEEGLTGELAAFVAAPFAIRDGQLLVRAGLFRLPTAHVFCLVAHHLVVDAISMGVLRDEFVSGYDARVADQPLAVEPARTLPEPDPDPASVRFWRSRLDGYVPQQSSLWLGNRDVDQEEPSLSGDAVQRDLSAEARDAVRRLRRELRAPDSVVLLAAYYLLLSLHGAGRDLIVGAPVSTRPAEALSAVGYHVNLLPLRVQVDPSRGFRDLVAATRSVFVDGLAHANVPAELLAGQMRTERTWRSAVFRYLFNYVPYLPGGTDFEFTVGGRSAQQIVDLENGFSRFDLEFFVPPFPPAERIRIRAVYRDQVFSRADVELLLSRYDELLVSVAADVQSAPAGWSPPAPPQSTAAPAAMTDDGGPDWLVENLLAFWQQILQREDLDADANFFHHGGTSLMGAMVVQRIKRSVGVPVKLADLFANPTPNLLAGRLCERLPY